MLNVDDTVKNHKTRIQKLYCSYPPGKIICKSEIRNREKL